MLKSWALVRWDKPFHINVNILKVNITDTLRLLYDLNHIDHSYGFCGNFSNSCI